MKMLAVLPLCMVALCAMECYVSAAPRYEPQNELEPTFESEQDEPKQTLELLETRGSEGLCTSGWKQFEEYCYVASDYGRDWQDAQDKCSSLDAELVKINSAEENEFVLQLAREKAPTADTVWIALFWDSSNKSWAWGDNSDPVYLNWNEGEPNGNAKEPCGEMYTSNVSDFPINGYWNDVPCNQPKGYVCKKLA